ncbi:MAG TPA: hypothetical protein VHB21_13505 [Minicystis sp.]|nr:hypothetical protein [Minicystis sp.]
MATRDAATDTIDVTITVLGARALEYLVALAEPLGLPRAFVEVDPSVPLALVGKDGGPRMVFHLSAYESDRLRSDAVLVAGEVDEDERLTGDEPRFEGGDPLAPARLASRIALDRIRRDALPPMPHEVREGLHRHDRAAAPVLGPEGAPRVGHQVKLQINLREDGGWLAMGGTVRAVLGADAVEAELVATTAGAPDAFDGTWRARLERKHGWEFPWFLTSLERVGA